jgi:hypothetical protein
MLPIPAPERGRSVEALASFLNLPSRNEFVLIVAWLLAALRLLSKVLKSLVDPNVAPVRAPAREERDLMIAANNGFCSPSTISPACPFGSRMLSAGSQAAAALPCGSSTPTTRRFCSKR